MDKLGIKDKVVIPELDHYLNNVSEEEKSAFESSTGLKWDDYVKAHKTAMNIHKGSNPTNVSVSSLFDKEDPFNTKK